MAFSEIEKINIKEKLILNCEESWSKYGFKKTNLDTLCAKSGISKGAFYLFYSSKEELFCDVMIKAQEELVNLTESLMGDNPTKYDLAYALKKVFRMLQEKPFVIETRTPDFIAFMNRLSKEKMDEMKTHSNYDLRDAIREKGLRYKIEEDKGLAILGILFAPFPNKEELAWNYTEVFDFMLDTMVEAIFE